VEEAFSKIKALLKKVAAPTRETSVEAIAAALSAITSEEVRGWFGHCGYELEAQHS
jgi:hypothetical protein